MVDDERGFGFRFDLLEGRVADASTIDYGAVVLAEEVTASTVAEEGVVQAEKVAISEVETGGIVYAELAVVERVSTGGVVIADTVKNLSLVQSYGGVVANSIASSFNVVDGGDTYTSIEAYVDWLYTRLSKDDASVAQYVDIDERLELLEDVDMDW